MNPPADPSKLHVGVLTPSYAGVTSAGSGIGVHFRNLTEGLLAAGHAVTVVVATEPEKITASALPPYVHLALAKPSLLDVGLGRLHWQLHQWFHERAGLRTAAQVARTMTGIDVWETTSTGAPALAFLKERSRAPVVTRVSTTASQLRETNRGVQTRISRIHERWEKAAVQGSDAIVTHSEGHRLHLAQEFFLAPASIRIIPHGIPIPPSTTRADRAGTNLLYVGRLEARKGIDLLLSALPSVLAGRPEVTVTLVGLDAGDYWQRHWRDHAPAAVQAQVTFAGVVDETTLAAGYRAADLLVTPSRYESFGLMFAEGMAWGLPVVALKAPGALDLVIDGRTGTLPPPEDVPALATAIAQLVDDRALRQEMSRAARAHALSHYSIEAMTEASVAYYREVIARKRSR